MNLQRKKENTRRRHCGEALGGRGAKKKLKGDKKITDHGKGRKMAF